MKEGTSGCSMSPRSSWRFGGSVTPAPTLRGAVRCLASAAWDATLFDSRFSARVAACDRFLDGVFSCTVWLCPAAYRAGRSSPSSARPRLGVAASGPRRRGGLSTAQSRSPASSSGRRACLHGCARISSRTNSPACVLGALPSRLSRRARSSVFFSGIMPPFKREARARRVPVRSAIGASVRPLWGGRTRAESGEMQGIATSRLSSLGDVPRRRRRDGPTWDRRARPSPSPG